MGLEFGDLPVSSYSAIVSSVALCDTGLFVSLCFSWYRDNGLEVWMSCLLVMIGHVGPLQPRLQMSSLGSENHRAQYWRQDSEGLQEKTLKLQSPCGVASSL